MVPLAMEIGFKLVATFVLLLTLYGCDTMSLRYEVDKCMEHKWIKGTYRITQKDGLDVHMKNLSDGNSHTISGMDRGWKEVMCP